MDTLSGRLTDAWGEAPDLDYKARFDPSSTGNCCERVKDIVATQNAGVCQSCLYAYAYGAAGGPVLPPSLSLSLPTVDGCAAWYAVRD